MGRLSKMVIIGIFKGIIDHEFAFSTKEQTKKSRLARIIRDRFRRQHIHIGIRLCSSSLHIVR